MAIKLVVFLALVAVAAQGQSVSEIWLPDVTSTYISNPLISRPIGIPILFLDTQVTCAIFFPNGARFDLFPSNSLIHDHIVSLNSVEPFNGCGVAFKNAPPSLSGTYELVSLVDHALENARTLTRQRFHLTFIESDSWIIPSKK